MVNDPKAPLITQDIEAVLPEEHKSSDNGTGSDDTSDVFKLTPTERSKLLPFLAVLGVAVQILRRTLGSWGPFESPVHHLLGGSIPPLTYVALRSIGCQEASAFLASLLTALEATTLTQWPHILLDSPIVFIIAASICLLYHPGNSGGARNNWLNPLLSGTCLGVGLYLDWQALFSITSVLMYMPSQLFVGEHKSCARRVTVFMVKFLCLVVSPFAVLFLLSGVHYQLSHPLGYFPRGAEPSRSYAVLGSNVTIRHFNTPDGFLYSEQWVSLHNTNNGSTRWLLSRPYEFRDIPAGEWDRNTILVENSGLRLRHIASHKYLHSHQVPAPVVDDPNQQEVTAYGMQGFDGDANDDWILEIPFSSGSPGTIPDEDPAVDGLERLGFIQRLIWAVNAGWTDRRLVDYRNNFWINPAHVNIDDGNNPPKLFAWQLAVISLGLYPALRWLDALTSSSIHGKLIS
ncbi:hypothetical protein ONZ45_g19552 [Pleurotus djamor]|nr:hypothetical protein ONZ45_g19552 [Pleurotus djamor]